MTTEIQLSNGNMFDYLNPCASEYTIHEVARALSRIPRFNGHTTEFYSVAQHSLIMSYRVPQYLALPALLHDMQEAFVCDIPTPLKHLLGVKYDEIEERVQRSMCKKFNVDYMLVNSAPIKYADLRMLATEKRDFMLDSEEWECLKDVTAYESSIPNHALMTGCENHFLSRYHELTIS